VVSLAVLTVLPRLQRPPWNPHTSRGQLTGSLSRVPRAQRHRHQPILDLSLRMARHITWFHHPNSSPRSAGIRQGESRVVSLDL
jgi:hypothetical protein